MEGWKYLVKNLFMYYFVDNGEVLLIEKEFVERLKGLIKEIDRYNIRFYGKMSDFVLKDDELVEVLYNIVMGVILVMFDRNRDKIKKYDLEDLRKIFN